MATLYRQYRPKNFSEVVNQQHIRLTLEHALEHDRVAHAYLFAGPRGIGKTSIARILARAANCTGRGAKSEPCNTCANCQAILAGRSLDIIEIDAASQTGVDNVRENIIQSARSAPSLGKYKVFVIDEVHMLSTAAFNALLKLLEEPPAHAMFILATTEVHRIPETIISRTQRFDFKKLQLTDIAERLQYLARQEKRSLENGVAERIARQSGGSLRDAESMLGQLFSFKEKTITQEIADLVLPRSDQALVRQIVAALVRRQPTEALKSFHAFSQEGGDIPTLVEELVQLSRALLLASVDSTLLGQILVEEDATTLQEMNSLVTESSTPFFTTMVEELLAAQLKLNRAAMMELPVEVAIITVAGQGGSRIQPTTVVPVATEKIEPAKVQKSSASTSKKAVIAAAADVQTAWKQIQSTISQQQPSLSLSVQQAVVTSSDNKTIQLKVPFKLHAERIMDPKHRGVLEDRLKELTGLSMKIEAQYDPSIASSAASVKKTTVASAQQPNGDLWDSVVENFQ